MQSTQIIVALFGATTMSALADTSIHGVAGTAISVEHAEIVTRPDGRATAYFVVWNGTPKQMNLLAIESRDFPAASMRRMEFAEGVARMRVADFLSIPGHTEIVMQPGGVHVMLSEPARKFSGTDTIPVDFVFEGGVRISAKATVLSDGASLTDHKHVAAAANP